MAFGDPIQWVVIAVVIVALFLWGPQKIPDLARAIGRARKEFDDASKEVSGAMSGQFPQSGSTAPYPPRPQQMYAPAPEKSGDQVLIETARQLGIVTEGKTRDQISQEIVGRVRPPA
jgi:sec-independent protein translocase protein TatA